MAIKMVREPSETPNINNIDDIVPMRYAYGNQNGYVINKGTEISNTVNGLNFTVNSGRLVLQGVECDIDASGVTITIDNIATTRYYVVYLQVNLGLNTAQILDTYDTATYPTIDTGDDLTENTTGIARLPLYRFIATSGVISNVNKVVESVKYINEDFIANVKVNDASKVNNLEIKQDENGVLKIGDIIIPQKKLLWNGDITSGTIALSTNLNVSDVLEVEWSIKGSDGSSGNTLLYEFISKTKLMQQTSLNQIYGILQPAITWFASNQSEASMVLGSPMIKYTPSNNTIDFFNPVSAGEYSLKNVTYNYTLETTSDNGVRMSNAEIHLKKIYKIIE